MADNENQENQQAAPAQDAQNGPRFSVQRIYIKDVSLETPGTPDAFRHPFNPQVGFNINTRSQKLDDNFYEVILRLTADVKQEDNTVYLVEVQQAGIFEAVGLEAQQLEQAMTISAPSILFPYGRETIDSLVVKAGYPPLMLAPINFEAVYLQAKQNQAQQTQAAESAETQ